MTIICSPDITGLHLEAGGCQLIYILLPLSPRALPVQQRVQGNRVGIQGNGRWPLIGQMGCQLLSGPQIIVLQYCPKTTDSVHSWRQFIDYIKSLFSALGGESFSAVKRCPQYTQFVKEPTSLFYFDHNYLITKFKGSLVVLKVVLYQLIYQIF